MVQAKIYRSYILKTLTESFLKLKTNRARVVIHYNFVGYLEIPENDEPCFTADIRQGVAIGYIAKPTEKSA